MNDRPTYPGGGDVVPLLATGAERFEVVIPQDNIEKFKEIAERNGIYYEPYYMSHFSEYRGFLGYKGDWHIFMSWRDYWDKME